MKLRSPDRVFPRDAGRVAASTLTVYIPALAGTSENSVLMGVKSVRQ